MDEEQKRLCDYRDRKSNWKRWGPYVAQRAWGTVRESQGEDPWSSLPFEEASKRPFLWGEDGLGAICDRFGILIMGFSFWNGKDPILKERLFGLGSGQGNHGEDVKEVYSYLDATPTSSYLKMRYHYPIDLFPYDLLKQENEKRGFDDPEYEITDTKVFDEDRYFSITFTYAKVHSEDIFCKVSIKNCSKEKAQITALPTVWFRNTWKKNPSKKPSIFLNQDHLELEADEVGKRYFYVQGKGEWIFCENDGGCEYPKDAFTRYVISQDTQSVNPQKKGTKAARVFSISLAPDQTEHIYCRLSDAPDDKPFFGAEEIFQRRASEADSFYQSIQSPSLCDELRKIQRRAFSSLLFSKQFYFLDQNLWKEAHPNNERNEGWEHLSCFDLISVPDKWEYPYLCSWDLAFHCITMVMLDPEFAKRQIALLTREWYIHPNGQIPAYEWDFSDVNPPVHAWALWRVYKMDAKRRGAPDRPFLEGCFHKLLINFTWWVNRKDLEGNNVFQGGFLGMDNISVFDRSRTLPTGGRIDQSDGSAWMGFYSLMMMKMALCLAEEEPIYQDSATKFFEHFLRIASAMTACGGKEGAYSLWDEKDGFFYDILHLPDGSIHPLKVRSLVGLIPLLAVETLEDDLLESMPVFKRRMEWFISKRPDMSCSLACLYDEGQKQRHLLAVVDKTKLIQILRYLFDEEEFLSPFGIRSLSKYHEKNPYTFKANSHTYEVKYVPGESDNAMFGGNSNWRGPIWMPINFLLIEALQRFGHYYGDQLKVEFPTRSGVMMNLTEIAKELSQRLITLFEGKEDKDHLFYEYFNPETGKGLGSCHQGWTLLIAKLIEQSGY